MLTRSLAAALTLLAAGPALAGGFAAPVAAPAPAAPVVVPVAPVATPGWSGAYLGAQLGFGRTTSVDELDDLDDFNDAEDEGSLLGLHAGYRVDLGAVVAGAELDWDRTSITLRDNSAAAAGPGDFDVDDRVDLDSVARAKVMLGFDAGRLLPYVTAGVARASQSAEFLEVEDTVSGRFVGLGAAYAISDRFTVGVEALRHDFSDMPTEGYDTQLDTLTLRGSFRF